MNKIVKSFFVFLLITTVCATTTQAASLETNFAKDTIIFAKIKNISKMQDKLANNGIMRLYRDKKVQLFLEKPLKVFLQKIAQNGEKGFSKLQSELKWTDEQLKTFEEKLAPDALLHSFSSIFSKGIAFGIQMPKSGSLTSKKDFSIIAFAEIPGKKQEVENLIGVFLSAFNDKLLISNKEYAGSTIFTIKPKVQTENILAKHGELNYTIAGEKIICSNNIKSIEQEIDALKTPRAENLLQSKKYQQTLQTVGGDADIVVYADIAKFYQIIPELNLPMAGVMAQSPATPRDVLEALGLHNLESMSVALNYNNDGGYSSKAALLTKGERKGILQLLSKSSAPMPVPAYLPTNIGIYESIRVSPKAIFDFLVKVANKVKPGAEAMVQMGLLSLQQQYNIDVANDFLPALGSEMAVGLILPNKIIDMSGMDPAMAKLMLAMDMSRILVLSFSLQDTEKIKTTIDAIKKIAGATNPMLGSSSSENYKGATINIIGMNMPGKPVPCYAIVEGKLFFALNIDTLKSIIKEIKNGTQGVAALPLCKKANAKLGNSKSKSTFLMLMNEGKYLRWYSALAKQMLQLELATKSQKQNEQSINYELIKAIDFSLWPDGDTIEKYLGFTLGRMKPVSNGLLFNSISVSQAAVDEGVTSAIK